MTTNRLLSRANLEAHAASDDDTRFQMHSLLLAEEGVVSTDGKWLLVTPYPDDELDEFPGDFPKEDVDRELDGSILPLPVAKAIAKALPRKSTRPILAHAMVSKVDDNSTARATVTDLETKQDFDIRLIEGKYPEWKRVMPEGEPDVKVTLGVKYLERLIKAAKKCKADRVTFEIRDPKNAVAFKYKSKAGGELAYGVIMPMVVQG